MSFQTPPLAMFASANDSRAVFGIATAAASSPSIVTSQLFTLLDVNDKLPELSKNVNVPYTHHWSSKDTIIIAAYGLLMVLSLFGNLLVCNVILFKRSMRQRTTNMFIANLTISDLILTLFAIPLYVVRVLLDNWPFGDILCKLLPFANSISVYVSVLSMTAIAIDRYQVLMRPLKQRTKTPKLPKSLILVLIWTVSALLSIPNAAYNTVAETPFPHYNTSLSRCRVEFPKGDEDFYYKWTTAATVLGQYLIPLTVVASCYTMIGMKISKRTCIGAATPAQWQVHSSAKRRTIKMLVLVVVVFAICWAPYNLLHILEDFAGVDPSLTTILATHWFAMSSICYNPFIYFWLSPGYRDGFRYILGFFGLKLGPKGTKRRNASRLRRIESGNTVCEMTTNNDLNRTITTRVNGIASSNESIEFSLKTSTKFQLKSKIDLKGTEIESLTMDGRDGETALL